MILASLPLKVGGCGLSVSFLKQLSVASTTVSYIFMHEEDILNANDIWYINEVLNNQVQHKVFSGKDINYNVINQDIKPFNVYKLQKFLSDELMENQISMFKNVIASDKYVLNKFNHISDENSGKFLLAIPRMGYTEFSNDEFQKSLSMRLMQPLFSSNLSIKCNCSKQQVVDEYGDHLLCCNFKNEWKSRHDSITRGIADLAKDAGLHVRIESKSNRMFQEDGSKLITDLTIFNSPLHNGKDVRFDVSVCHSTAKDTKGSNVKKREQLKNNKYADAVKENNTLFYPLVISSQGVFSETFANLVSSLCSEVSKRSNRPYSVIKHHWLVKISCILQKSNSSIIINKMDSICSKHLFYTMRDKANLTYIKDLVILEN